MTALAKKEIKKAMQQNELANILDRGLGVFKFKRSFAFAVLAALVALGFGIFGLKAYRLHQIKAFNEEWFAAEESLSKEANYNRLLQEFANVNATDLVRLQLADYKIENQKSDEALQVLAVGLQKNEANILTTALVLKSLEIYRTQQKYKEARLFIGEKRHQVLLSYQPHLRLFEAEFLLAEGDVSGARLIFTELAQSQPAEVQEAAKEQVQKLAQDKLLQLELAL